MNIYELIKEAKIRYPIGTVYYPTNTKVKQVILNHDFINYQGIYIMAQINGSYVKADCNLCLYSDNVWATIISKPINKSNYYFY